MTVIGLRTDGKVRLTVTVKEIRIAEMPRIPFGTARQKRRILGDRTVALQRSRAQRRDNLSVFDTDSRIKHTHMTVVGKAAPRKTSVRVKRVTRPKRELRV